MSESLIAQTETLPPNMTDRTAHFLSCCNPNGTKRYRVWLMRRLDMFNERALLAMMMNPSLAGFVDGDPTTSIMTGFGLRWRFGRYGAVNMDPSIEPDSRKLILVPDHIWELNLQAIKMALDWVDRFDGRIITAWGAHDWRDERMEQVMELLKGRELLRFGTNRDGSPRFPRAIRKDTEPEIWQIPTTTDTEVSVQPTQTDG